VANGGIQVRRLGLSAAVLIGAMTGLSLPARAADILTKSPPQTAVSEAPSTVLWAGGDFKDDVEAETFGGIHALSGGLDHSGWLIRGDFTAAQFGFNTNPGSANGDLYRGDGSIGYQTFTNGWVASGYLGLGYEQYNFSPASAGNPSLHDQFGLMLTGRLATAGTTPYPVSLDGQYLTANNEFWLRARIGARFGAITVGPELIGLGNVAWDEVRFGGYVEYQFSRDWIVQGDLGYANGSSGDLFGHSGTGVYGGVGLVYLH